jgi:RES domain-containing protein
MMQESRALAALEFYVHLSRTVILPGLSVVSVEIPDSVSRKEMAMGDLPKDWRAYPAPPELAAFGAEWVRSRESLLLFVPSAIMPPERNVLINPVHPEMKEVRIRD